MKKKGIRLITIFDWIDAKDVIEILKDNYILENQKFIKTDNALGFTVDYMKEKSYELLKEDKPYVRYKIVKSDVTHLPVGKTDLIIHDCGHRIWRKI